MTDRYNRILEVLTSELRVEVVRLAELLNVSAVTVRKDLDQMETLGLIRREHGFAVINDSDDIGNRLAYHYESKRAIAAAAAGSVANGETVMIESGSCCALLAYELAKTKQDVTIITNSAFIAGYIRRIPGARIVLLGGEYQCVSQVLVGPVARRCAQEYHVDKLFIGTDGFSEGIGFTGADSLRAETVRDMAKQAACVIILTESEKFSQHGVVSLLSAEEVGMVYTDNGIPKKSEEFLRSKGVQVIKVEI